MNVHTRQMVLERSIGPMPEETYAYYLIQALAYGFPLGLMISTVLRFVLYLVYNRKVHPFLVLIKDQKPEEQPQESNDIELVPMNRQDPGEQPEQPEVQPEPAIEVKMENVESSQSPLKSKPAPPPKPRNHPQLRQQPEVSMEVEMEDVESPQKPAPPPKPQNRQQLRHELNLQLANRMKQV